MLDVAGRFAAPILTPGAPAYVFGSFEAATVLGSTNELRTLEQATSGAQTSIQQYGGAAILGFVLGGEKYAPKPAPGGPKLGQTEAPRPDLYGKLVTQIEVGYASGDANPNDGVEKRFVFDPNHKVGLILFDEVLRFATARSASAAQDPLLANAARPTPGIDLLPSNGGVFGAEYIYPTMLYRPVHWLDLKGGAVIAQTTADFVDPYRLVATPHPKVVAPNYFGGDSSHHDLGLELDVGVEARVDLGKGIKMNLGAQGGVLFPGSALEDENGVRIKTPWLGIGRAGLMF